MARGRRAGAAALKKKKEEGEAGAKPEGNGGIKKTDPAGSSLADLIIDSITFLQDRKGSSVQAIKKCIVARHAVDMAKETPNMKKALLQLEESGQLIRISGKGATGSFKLGVKLQKACPPIKAAVEEEGSSNQTSTLDSSKKSRSVAKKKVDCPKDGQSGSAGSSVTLVMSSQYPQLPPPPTIPSLETHRLAEAHKNKGNELFRKQVYHEALEHYSKAIYLIPSEGAYFSNRAACNMMMKRYAEARLDSLKTLQLNPHFAKGHLRLIRACLALGLTSECDMAFATISQLGLEVSSAQEWDRLCSLKKLKSGIEVARAAKNYKRVDQLAVKGLEIASEDPKLKLERADALIRLGKIVEGQKLCDEVLLRDKACREALYIKARSYYLLAELDISLQYARQGLRFAPDNESFQRLSDKLKVALELRDSASSKYAEKRYEEAKSIYLEYLAFVTGGEMNNVTIQAKVVFNLAMVSNKQGKLDAAIEYCTRALNLDTRHAKALLLRARIYVRKELFDNAIHDFEAVLRIEPSMSTVQELQSAKLAARRAKNVDHYKILNVGRNASEEEIRKAYKKGALLHHPDKHVKAPENVRKEHEKMFKAISQAYEILSNVSERWKYDRGADEGGKSGGEFLQPGNPFFSKDGIPARRMDQAPVTKKGRGSWTFFGP